MITDALRDKKFPIVHGSGAMPAVGFGTLFKDLSVTTEAVKSALEAGFRHFDCAERYQNEEKVGVALEQALQSGKLRREDLFITTKLWNSNHQPERVAPAFEASRKRLKVDYIDCYIIHTPFAFQAGDEQAPRDAQGQIIYDKSVTLLETWRAMEQLVDAGKCKSIGLSDITLDAVKEIVAEARIKPAAVQVESHPYLPEWELLEFCQQNGIILLAFAPLGHGADSKVQNDPVITGVAQRLSRTPAQVLLAWSVQRGAAFLTTSATPSHIRENFEIESLPQWAMVEINENVTTRKRLNSVIETGIPGFIPE